MLPSIKSKPQFDRDELFNRIMSQLETNIGNRLAIERSRIKTLTQSSLVKLSREANQIKSYQQLQQWFRENEPAVVSKEKLENKQLEP